MATHQTEPQVGVTPGALRAMQESGQEWDFFVGLHRAGICGEEDRGDLGAVDRGGPLVTAHRTLKGRDILVMSDDGPFTAVLLPDE